MMDLQLVARRPRSRVAPAQAERLASEAALDARMSADGAALDGEAWSASVSRDDPRTLRRTFRRLGHLQVPELGVTEDDLDEVQRLLDGLFGRFSELPKNLAHERALSDDPTVVLVPEIIQCARIEPRLLRTPVFEAVASLASDLLGGGSRMVFDHAIYKPPGSSASTPWHQDSAYGGETGLAIWVPLQTTGVADGCMRFVPGSHHGGKLRHERGMTEGHVIWYLDDRLVESLDPVSAPIQLGGVTVHDRKMIHGAWPNVGSEWRRAWIIGFRTPTRRNRILGRLRPPSAPSTV